MQKNAGKSTVEEIRPSGENLEARSESDSATSKGGDF